MIKNKKNEWFLTRIARNLPKVIIDILWLAIPFICSQVARLLKKRANIWLIGERFDEARDNGYHLFKYIRANHPEINAIYVISSTSPDYFRVSEIGPVVHWGSLRHAMYWFRADCIASAHDGKLAPHSYLCRKLVRWGVHSKRSVMLQHGVTGIQLPKFMLKAHEVHRIISVSSKKEQKFLWEHGGHGVDEARLLGFCRFDSLYTVGQPLRKILLMPTWRRWLRALESQYGVEGKVNAFRKSEYFCAYDSLINSGRLHDLLTSAGYKLVFYPHYQMQQYIDAFGDPHESILIANRSEYDVQDLLKKSAVLITDFSSVSFDFAFMKKPVLYFIPDEERFFREHAQRGYFDFEVDGFGPVAREADAVINALEEILANESKLAPVYQSRVKSFFAFHDNRNCERTFDAIKQFACTA